MSKNNSKIIKTFLRESNLIEGVNSAKADREAYKAWKYLEAFDKLNFSRILGAHKILMQELNPRIAGKLRNVNVRVGSYVAPDYCDVEKLLKLWVERHGEHETLEGIRTAHLVFEDIHPFEDGNGRTGRLLMMWQWVKNDFPVKVIRARDRQIYYAWFNDSRGV